MITSFEVGAVFRIINEASPQLTKILRQVRELTAAVDKARESLALVTKPLGLTAAIGETDKLAASWGRVAESAAVARRAMSQASGAVGSAGRHYPGRGGGASVGGPPVSPSGGRGFHGGAAAALGLAGYAVYQAAQYEDATVLMAQHAGVDWKANRDKFRKVLQDASIGTGFGEHDVSLAAQQELRMFGDTGGSNGVDVLPKMLRYAATEARLKGTGLEEAMSSMTGLAHMLRKYSESDVDKLAPAFSALSVRNPMSLAQQERAFGYAVPLLSSQGMDPYDVMAASTALARAGITSTKGGTWIREMATRAMPGTSLMSQMAFKRHEEALKAFGLVDDHDAPTWFEGGKPNLTKLLSIASENAGKIPLDKRMSYERALFGAQGSGAMAVLSDPAVRQQMGLMSEEMQNPANVNRVRNFMGVYGEQSTVQSARTAMQEFNVLMSDIGTNLLPPVNRGLSDLKGVLEALRGVLPSGSGWSGSRIATRAGEGAIAGGVAGTFMGGVGAVPGALIGGVTGGAFGVAEQYMDNMSKGGNPVDRFGRQVVITGNSAAQAAEGMKALGDAIRGLPGKAGGIFPGGASQVPPIHLSIDIDGRALAQAVSERQAQISTYQTDATGANGSLFFAP